MGEIWRVTSPDIFQMANQYLNNSISLVIRGMKIKIINTN